MWTWPDSGTERAELPKSKTPDRARLSSSSPNSVFSLVPKVSAALWERTREAKLRFGGGRVSMGAAWNSSCAGGETEFSAGRGLPKRCANFANERRRGGTSGATKPAARAKLRTGPGAVRTEGLQRAEKGLNGPFDRRNPPFDRRERLSDLPEKRSDRRELGFSLRKGLRPPGKGLRPAGKGLRRAGTARRPPGEGAPKNPARRPLPVPCPPRRAFSHSHSQSLAGVTAEEFIEALT